MTHVTHVYSDTRDSMKFFIPRCGCGWRGHSWSTERDAQDEALLHLQGATHE